MSQTRSNAGEEVDGVSDGEELEDAVESKPSRAERKAAKRRAKRDGGSGKGSAAKSTSRPARKKRTSPALFIRQIIAEMRKVVWPTRGELFTYTSVVIVFVVAIIGIVALFDYGITHAVSAIFG